MDLKSKIHTLKTLAPNFSEDLIKKALQKSRNDQNEALNLLLDGKKKNNKRD